jgi:hypothetical protein
MAYTAPQDFTDPRRFLNYLGSFWNQIFSDKEAVLGLMSANSEQLTQLYTDFIDLINQTSVFTTPPTRRETLRPVFVYESKISTSSQLVEFGTGLNFGGTYSIQSRGIDPSLRYGGQARNRLPYFVDVDPSIQSVGNVLLNRLYNPSVTLVKGVDFMFEDNSVLFKENPFLNPLIPTRVIPLKGSSDPAATDKLIVLWAVNCEVDDLRVHQQYGYIYFNSPVENSKLELNIVQQLFKIYAGGPTLEAIDSLICAVAGGAQTTEAKETVEYITTNGISQVVVTDMSVYTIDPSDTLRSNVVPGTVLSAGTPLTNRTSVCDSYTKPNWWMTVPGVSVRDDYCVFDISNVSFLNTEVPFNSTGSKSAADGRTVLTGNFFLAGSKSDTDTFWSSVAKRETQSDQYVSEMLWKEAGIVNADGSPNFNKPLYLNPLRIFAEKIAGMSFIVVTISSVQFSKVETTLTRLRQVLPVGTSLLVVLQTSVSDSLSLDNPIEFQQLSSPTTDGTEYGYLQALIEGKPEKFPAQLSSQWLAIDDGSGLPLANTSEALSQSYSPDILNEPINLISLIYEEVSAINTPTCT